MKVVALLLLSGLAAVSASCPNDCNGHGSCNVYSACDCYRNWMGADCSERVCYFGLAFVDTPAGDVNTDGLISGDTGIRTRMSNAETYEIYPWYAGWGGTHYSVRAGAGTGAAAGNLKAEVATSGGAGGEAHFYKECSNKGICNRQSGECECFPGFTGEGCTRTACPDDCSGHGTCTRMVDKSPAYRGWDLYATQECSCDPGYFGPNCSLRKCPMGDDPVTKYEGFTRITLQDKATYGGADGFGHYNRDKCADGNRANSDQSDFSNESVVANNAGAFSSATINVADPHLSNSATSDWVYRIWSHDKATGTSAKFCASSPASNNHCYGWSPWYSVGGASSPRQTIDNSEAAKNDTCGWSGAGGLNTAICEQNPVKFRDTTVKGTSALSSKPMVVYGTASHASGTMTGGGCAHSVFDSATTTHCTDLDFWSLYLKDVTGQFQVGDTLRIDGYASNSPTAARTFGYELCNYIKEIGTYYASASNKTQQDEEQLLIIDYTNVTANTNCTGEACTHLEGSFSLEFTDEMGDTWMTEGIKIKGSSRTTLNGATYDFLAADATDGFAAGAAATGHGVAVQIQNALEALPNDVVSNVQVEYRPDSTSNNFLNLRFYTVSFLTNTGNIPQLQVAYSFTDTVGANKVMASNAECETTGGSGATAAVMNCIPYFGRASSAQKAFATAAISSTEGSASATMFDHSRAPSTAIGDSSGIYGKDGTKENVECSNRGLCDYSTGMCQCFAGFTNRDCSVQNSLAMS